MTTTTTDIPALLDDYVVALQAMLNKHAEGRPYLRQAVFVEMGRKFARVGTDNGTQRSVHAFVDMTTGDVIKPAGWKAPQKDKSGLAVRYCLADPASKALCFERMDPYGAYLYQR